MVLGLVATMLAGGCGRTSDAPEPQPAANVGGLLQIRYVAVRFGGIENGGDRLEIEVITDGTERSRTTWAVYVDEGPADETFLTIRDGNRALQYNDQADPPYTVLEAADEHPEVFPLLSSPLQADSARFRQACPGASPAGTRTILGRDAVGYACTWDEPDPSLPQADEIWLDLATGMILEHGDYKAEQVIADPVVDATTFSTKAPTGADVYVIKATRRGKPSPEESQQPELSPEAQLLEVAASTSMPIYYLGTEFGGVPLTDVAIFDDATGAQAMGDLSLDADQSLSLMYGDLVAVDTNAFRPDQYQNAAGCRRLADLRGVPTVEQSDAVWLFTADVVVRLGSMAYTPERAAEAAAALREVGQHEPTGADLPPPPARSVALIDIGCGAHPGDHGEPIED